MTRAFHAVIMKLLVITGHGQVDRELCDAVALQCVHCTGAVPVSLSDVLETVERVNASRRGAMSSADGFNTLPWPDICAATVMLTMQTQLALGLSVVFQNEPGCQAVNAQARCLAAKHGCEFAEVVLPRNSKGSERRCAEDTPAAAACTARVTRVGSEAFHMLPAHRSDEGVPLDIAITKWLEC